MSEPTAAGLATLRHLSQGGTRAGDWRAGVIVAYSCPRVRRKRTSSSSVTRYPARRPNDTALRSPDRIQVRTVSSFTFSRLAISSTVQYRSDTITMPQFTSWLNSRHELVLSGIIVYQPVRRRLGTNAIRGLKAITAAHQLRGEGVDHREYFA